MVLILFDPPTDHFQHIWFYGLIFEDKHVITINLRVSLNENIPNAYNEIIDYNKILDYFFIMCRNKSILSVSNQV